MNKQNQKPDKGKAYRRRAIILRRFGFKNYQEYLNSDMWRKIRAKQLRMKPRCYACGDRATQVHHGKYTFLNMFGHSMEYLFSVCRDCHSGAEFNESGAKVSARIATRKLKKAHYLRSRDENGEADELSR